MENLPVEAVAHVLKFLTSLTDRKACSLVCKSWYEAYQDPLFRNVEVLHITSDERFEALLRLKNEDRKYFYLVMKEVEIGGNDVRFWERFGPHFKALSMLGCDIGEKTFVSVLKKCPRLESLCVRSCRELFMVGNLLEDANERSILKETLKTLTSLDLSYNRYLSDAVFVKFTEVFQNIKKLFLSGCQISFFSGLHKRYYPQGRTVPSESVFTFPVILEYIRKNSRRVEHLSFGDTFIDNMALDHLARVKGLRLSSLELRGCFQLSHGGVTSLSENQKSLTVLDVSLCPRVTDGSLFVICSGLPNLVSLSVQRCRAITDLGVSALWQLEKLNHLNVSECDLIEGEGLLKGLCRKMNPGFRELRLGHLGNMTEDVVDNLSKYLPNLSVLDLGFCYNAVTDESVQSILRNNRGLRTLILTMCEKLTDGGLTGTGSKRISMESAKEPFEVASASKTEIEAQSNRGIGETCDSPADHFSGFSMKTLKGLRRLSLCGCRGIGDNTLMQALESTELRDLDLSHCNGITDRGLESLSKNNPAIESLNLELCHGVNNEGVRHVVQNLKRLRTLVLGSNNINDPAAYLIARYGKGIRYLDLRHCSRISGPAINVINENLPRLQDFHFPKRSTTTTNESEDVRIPVPPEPFGLWLK